MITEDHSSLTSSNTTWSSSAVLKVKYWLWCCTTSHAACNGRPEEIRLPTRLIDVDPEGSVSAPSHACHDLSWSSLECMPEVVLRTSSGLPRATRYLTLSHRWDPIPSIRLTSKTLPVFAKALPPSLLFNAGSKTFKEAIEVTGQLGFRYLWIDTICINQDDEAEKAREISVMDQIYKNGWLNISTTGATTASDGLFHQRRPLIIEKLYPALDDDSRRVSFVTASLPGRWNRAVESAALNTRGWIYQERMLSPRVIHFARDQVYWECFVSDASDEYIDHIKDKGSHFRNFNKSDMATLNQGNASMLWNHTVESYSALSLSFARDRLPAISSIARHFCAKARFDEADYVAGCWRLDLPYGLYWIGQGRTKSDKYIAPSWSWASTGSPVIYRQRFGYRENIRHVQVIKVSVQTRYDDPFGEIISGYIQLRCSLCRVFWPSQSGGVIIPHIDGNVTPADHLRLYWDDTVLQDVNKRLELRNITPHNLESACGVFYLVPLGDFYDKSYCHFGLILQRTAQRGQYERVGAFEYGCWNPSMVSYDMFVQGIFNLEDNASIYCES